MAVSHSVSHHASPQQSNRPSNPKNLIAIGANAMFAQVVELVEIQGINQPEDKVALTRFLRSLRAAVISQPLKVELSQ